DDHVLQGIEFKGDVQQVAGVAEGAQVEPLVELVICFQAVASDDSAGHLSDDGRGYGDPYHAVLLHADVSADILLPLFIILKVYLELGRESSIVNAVFPDAVEQGVFHCRRLCSCAISARLYMGGVSHCEHRPRYLARMPAGY